MAPEVDRRHAWEDRLERPPLHNHSHNYSHSYSHNHSHTSQNHPHPRPLGTPLQRAGITPGLFSFRLGGGTMSAVTFRA